MTYLFLGAAIGAIFYTADTMDLVFFRKRFIRIAMDFLKTRHGEGPRDEYIAEKARRELVMWNVSVAIICWAIVGWLLRGGHQ